MLNHGEVYGEILIVLNKNGIVDFDAMADTSPTYLQFFIGPCYYIIILG